MEIKFLLNDTIVTADVHPAKSLLDFLRKEKHLTSVKEVCKEGDCGACTVLLGELVDDELCYKNIASCIYPIANVAGKHIVTLEGLNLNELNLIQKYFAEEGAAQCGFCTPGYVSSLTSFLLSATNITLDNAYNSIAGNICRCTGYGSIKRAVKKIVNEFSKYEFDKNRIEFLVNKKVLPEYFISVKEKLSSITKNINETEIGNSSTFVAGGTDLLVQKPNKLLNENVIPIEKIIKKKIYEENENIVFSSTVTFDEFFSHPTIQNLSKNISEFEKLVASQLIRNAGTLAGNIVNASPIGDLSIILLALNATLIIRNFDDKRREVNLREFYKAYKKIDLCEGEFIEAIRIPKSVLESKFNFEKVSKRKYLDIASVNTAAIIETENKIIKKANISAGGVYSYPKLLDKTNEFLVGKEISNEVVIKALEIVQSEISPISDIRGSEKYKRALLNRLIFAHFAVLFPNEIDIAELI